MSHSLTRRDLLRYSSMAVGLTGFGLRSAFAQSSKVTISTGRFNNSRTNWNSQETLLTPTNVSGGHFGKLGSYAVDGDVYTQPLIIPDVTVSAGLRDLLIVASAHNTVYAFDANTPNTAPIWSRNLGTSRTSYPNVGGQQLFYSDEIGIMSTPVVDVANGFVYVVAGTSAPAWILNKINLSDGTVASSVTITGTVSGTGDPSTGSTPGSGGNTDTVSGGVLTFNPGQQTGRSALTLSSGKVYVCFGGYSDQHPYHGWIMGYNASSLAQTGVFCTSPSAGGAGLWMGASGGPSVDASGNIIVVTGNGDYDGATAWSMSILKLNPSTLAIIDSYTPSDWATMNGSDSDLGSSSAMMIPGTTRIVAGAKDYRVFQVDSANMGGLGGANSGATAQVFASDPAGVISTHSGIYNGTFFNGSAFFPNTNGKIFEFAFSSGSFNTTPTATSSPTFEFPGAQMSGSSNGTSTPILWAMTTATSALYTPANGTLRALNPATLAEYYNSDTRDNDATGGLAKYAAPTVANGRVYVSTFGRQILVFGLLPSSIIRGQGTFRGQGTIR
jgi:hypothetical protein